MGETDSKVSGRLKFARAARFLHFIVQDLQTASLNDLLEAELASAQRVVSALEKEQARLHAVLQRHLPRSPQAARRVGADSHPESIIHRLLERLDRDCTQPVRLKDYAREMGLNAAYLSHLFSKAVGIPFKTYLTELRLEKAKEMLGDPAKRVSDVGWAVGYTSEDRFRIAFKKATGFCPREWRRTIEMKPSPASEPRGDARKQRAV